MFTAVQSSLKSHFTLAPAIVPC